MNDHEAERQFGLDCGGPQGSYQRLWTLSVMTNWKKVEDHKMF